MLLFAIAIYGGYFGAGIGILVIAALDLIGLTDIHSILPLKNALSGALRAVAVTVFIVEGNVNWEYGLVMATGALLGGYVGGSVGRWTNRTIVRIGIAIFGSAMAGYYFWKIYARSNSRYRKRLKRTLTEPTNVFGFRVIRALRLVLAL